MAKYTVNHTCGHDREYQLFGPTKDRNRKLEWLGDRDCPSCSRKAEGPVARITIVDEPVPALSIAITNSFEIKEELKARGYKFVREAVCTYEGNDLLKAASSPPQPAWCKTFQGAPQYVADNAEVELCWIEQRGWATRTVSGLAALMNVLIEGRADLVGAAPSKDTNPVSVRFGPVMSKILGYEMPKEANQ